MRGMITSPRPPREATVDVTQPEGSGRRDVARKGGHQRDARPPVRCSHRCPQSLCLLPRAEVIGAATSGLRSLEGGSWPAATALPLDAKRSLPPTILISGRTSGGGKTYREGQSPVEGAPGSVAGFRRPSHRRGDAGATSTFSGNPILDRFKPFNSVIPYILFDDFYCVRMIDMPILV